MAVCVQDENVGFVSRSSVADKTAHGITFPNSFGSTQPIFG